MEQLDADIDTKFLFDQIEAGKNRFNLAQKCEAMQAERVKMTPDEKLHILSNCGPGSACVRVTPLKWKHCDLKLKQWIVTTRRRLNLLVAPHKTKCRICREGHCNIKGEHQVSCAGLLEYGDMIFLGIY